MGVKSQAAKALAWWEVKRNQKLIADPVKAQKQSFRHLLDGVGKTDFGSAHHTSDINSWAAWQQAIPVKDYEGLRTWFDRVKEGEPNVLWPGRPAYLCKTSGTTSGTKYIPMSEEGIKAQVRAARSALLHYVQESGNSHFTEGQMIFLQGSPVLEEHAGLKVGRLSGIVAHHVPSYLQRNRMPSWETNCMEDWERKVDAVVDETAVADMRLISGIPPWVQMYFERLLAKTGKASVREVFPNLSLFVYGGVNYEPYRPVMEKLMGGKMDSIETYPASEGFIAYQDSQQNEGMLLNLDAGIFYEFIPLSEVHSDSPKRLTVEEVKVGVNYALVLNTSSGLWGYLIGDTVKFVSVHPHRLIVTGRIKHFISAFGEHVIAEEVESALGEVCQEMGIEVLEFHVAPEVNPAEGLPYHEWFIELDATLPKDFSEQLDQRMQAKNSYYKDLVSGAVLRPLVIKELKRGAFNRYMDSIGKLGGQNKLPRLANDRKLADQLN